MAPDPERERRPNTLAEARGTQWPVCLCSSPPQIMDMCEDPVLFRCPACGATHDRRWFRTSDPERGER